MRRQARALMLQGTSSHVGKTVLVGRLAAAVGAHVDHEALARLIEGKPL